MLITQDASYAYPSSEDLKYLGHETRFKSAKEDSIGYVYGKRFRDVVVVPPLSNITVRYVFIKPYTLNEQVIVKIIAFNTSLDHISSLHHYDFR